jgi:hypothetical protein
MQALEHALDGAVRGGFRAGGVEAKKAVGFAARLRVLRDGMAELYPDYVTARNVWRANTEAVEAPRLAQQMLTPKGDVLDAREWLASASPQGSSVFRQTARDEIVRMLDLPRVGLNPVRFLRERVGPEKLRLVFGVDAMNRLDEIAQALQVMMETGARVAAPPVRGNLAARYGDAPPAPIAVGRPFYAIPRELTRMFDIRAARPGTAARVELGAPLIARALTAGDEATQEGFVNLLLRDRNRGIFSHLFDQSPMSLLGAGASGATGTFIGRQGATR